MVGIGFIFTSLLTFLKEAIPSTFVSADWALADGISQLFFAQSAQCFLKALKFMLYRTEDAADGWTICDADIGFTTCSYRSCMWPPIINMSPFLSSTSSSTFDCFFLIAKVRDCPKETDTINVSRSNSEALNNFSLSLCQ